jgi:hypothetical protein
MKQEELSKILADHKYWLESGGEKGVRANLSGADLSWANLSKAKNIISLGPMPTSGRIIYIVRHPEKEGGAMVQAGCFWGTLDELEAKVKASHNCPIYLGFIETARIWAKMEQA